MLFLKTILQKLVACEIPGICWKVVQDFHLSIRVPPPPQKCCYIRRNCKTRAAQQKSKLLDTFKNRSSSVSFPLLPQYFYLLSTKKIFSEIQWKNTSKASISNKLKEMILLLWPVSSLMIHWTFSSFGFIPARLNRFGAACYMAKQTWTDIMQFCNFWLLPTLYYSYFI